MIDRSKCYEILGVQAGVSREELKAAHRDLSKVWHPDRFAHDPRLQAKAQEKLKEINDAFDQLTSKPKRLPVTPRHGKGAEPYHERRVNRRSATSQLGYWRGMLIAVLMFGLMFFFTLRSIRQSQEQGRLAATEPIAAVEIEEQSNNHRNADELARGKNRNKEPSDSAESVPRQAIGSATALQPIATATVTIDPMTGMVARRECPTRTTMTYPKGNEPHEYCNVHKPLPPLQAESQQPKESRIKSVTRRLVSPSKW